MARMEACAGRDHDITEGRMTTETSQLDRTELEERVKGMYEEVALEPEQEFHFETGRSLAERLGYPVGDLDRIPTGALESFAGVGYFLDLAAIGGSDSGPHPRRGPGGHHLPPPPPPGPVG